MELTRETLETIGGYVREHLALWMRDVTLPPQQTDPVLLERIVRVEEELRSQRELMKQGFEQVDKRFEQVDKRFEQVDKRFEQVDKRFEQIDRRFDQIDKRFEQVDKRIDQNDKRFDLVDRRLDDLRSDMNARFDQADRHMNRWMTAMTLVLALVGIAVTLTQVLL